MKNKTKKFRVAVLTASDRRSAGQGEDLSGQKIVEICEAHDFDICFKAVLPDEQTELSDAMRSICDTNQADLILTTGGTGLTPRDCMPEATEAVMEKNVPGIAEAIRSYSLQITKRGMLSRGMSVIRKQTLIINLPGSPKAVDEILSYIIDQLPHALGLMKDDRAEEDKH